MPSGSVVTKPAYRTGKPSSWLTCLVFSRKTASGRTGLKPSAKFGGKKSRRLRDYRGTKRCEKRGRMCWWKCLPSDGAAMSAS